MSEELLKQWPHGPDGEPEKVELLVLGAVFYAYDRLTSSLL